LNEPLNTLISFIYDSRCYEICEETGYKELTVAAGNVGILISEYCKDPTIGETAFEVLVGDRVLFDVEEDSFKELGKMLC
jgi:hypothetical protein